MLTNPRQVKLKQCSIWSPTLFLRAQAPDQANIRANGIDISETVVSIDIFESIFQNTITATLKIREADGYPEYFPLTGTEFIFLTFVVDDADGNETVFSRTFRIHRLYNQTFESNEQRVYSIDLVTPEFFSSISSRITKCWRNTTVIGAVRDVLKNYLNVQDSQIIDSDFEETVGEVNVVIPNYTPLQTINFFSLLALTPFPPFESNYVFYETLNGFHFQSIAKMIRQGKLGLSTPPIPTFTVNANKLTGAPKIDAADAFNSIIQIHQEEAFDVLKDIATGMLRTKMLHLDFFGRKWNEEDSRYTESFQKTTHLDDFPCYPDNFDQSINRNVKLFVVPTNVSVAQSSYVLEAGEKITPQRLYESIVMRNRQMKEIQHLRTLLEVPGNPGLRAGSLVNINYPSSRAIQNLTNNPSVGGQPQLPTPYHSGLHLITHVRHSMVQISLGTMEYTMHLEATRDSFGSPLTAYVNDLSDIDGKAE